MRTSAEGPARIATPSEADGVRGSPTEAIGGRTEAFADPTEAIGGRTEAIVERAVAWALARVGSRAYELRCLSFVEDAYERANGIEVFGGSTARESAQLYLARPDGAAPRGAFVFFRTSGMVDGVRRDWGHVGLALGDGRMVHTWPDVRVDAIADVPGLPSGTWSRPRYVGWAGPERILRGARTRPAG